jgi:hypothetical protein
MKGFLSLVLVGAMMLQARAGAPGRRIGGGTRMQEVSHVDQY